jgi:hypothetical protein
MEGGDRRHTMASDSLQSERSIDVVPVELCPVSTNVKSATRNGSSFGIVSSKMWTGIIK